MTIAFWCVCAALLLPYGATLFAKRKMHRKHNQAPRAYKATLEGAEQRAVWAEANQFESFPAFAAAVIIAHLAGADQSMVDTLALIYIGARILYFYCYISNRSSARTIVWFIALGAVVGQFICAAMAGP